MSQKIAVIGPPGTGKSKFARALSKWDGWDQEWNAPVVIDNYVQRLQKKTGLALGPWSSYVENFMVAGERMKHEEANSALPTITVGTILDSMMYSMMHADIVLHKPNVDKQTAYIQAQTAVQTMAMWYTETWGYNLAFFLPFPPHDHTVSWERQYAALLPEVLDTYMVPGVVTIPEGTMSERVRLAQEVIEIARTEEAAQVPQAQGR